MKAVLIAAGGAGWESGVIASVEAHANFHIARRCVDIPDLLSAASTTEAVVALIALESSGLDADAMYQLEQAGVQTIAIDASPADAAAIGVASTLGSDQIHLLERTLIETQSSHAAQIGAGASPGRIVSVWGPAGAPGRTTLALSLAHRLAAKGHSTVLVDADPYGGSTAQMLGILDEVSGLLAACRSANNGDVDHVDEHLYALRENFSILTGLPRPGLWQQVRPGAFELLLDGLGSRADFTVIDCGFSLDPTQTFDSAAPRRDAMTMISLERADTTLAVGRADPVGLTRLVRGLHDLEEAVPGTSPEVVVNMMRPSIGWSEDEIAATVRRLVGHTPGTFLPLDQETVDASLIAGRLVGEVAADSRLAKALDRFVHVWLTQHEDRDIIQSAAS